jgi:ABC-2 type transport system ATP-binding protein
MSSLTFIIFLIPRDKLAFSFSRYLDIRRYTLMLQDDRSNFPGSAAPVLLAQELRKFYGRHEALRGLSFSLEAGRILGFLGPNGAGKTTAIRILTTILEPSAGHFRIDGVSSDQPDRIRRRIGVLPESLGFPRQVSGLEYLAFFGQLYGRSAGDARATARALLQSVGLQERGNSLIKTYSRGMRQRLGIARALVSDPVVVFLDEPTLGLDPRGQQELLALIQRIAREHNAGVILCSHLLAEVESVCDDVVILSAGQVVAQGSVTDVISRAQRSAARRNTLRVQVPIPALTESRRLLEVLPQVGAVMPSGDATGWLWVEMAASPDGDSADQMPLVKNSILKALIQAGIPIQGLEAGGGRLQDVFLQLTEEETE